VELCTSHEQILAGFDLSTFGAAPTKFDREDLWPLTSRYLAALPFERVRDDILAAGVPGELAEAFWGTVRENLRTRADIAGWWAVFRHGAEARIPEEDRAFVETALGMLPPMPYDAGTWEAWTGAVKAATGRKGRGLYMPLRLLLTGREKGPEMADVMPLLQKPPRLA
jgi:glutamyl-tRNA synthetase